MICVDQSRYKRSSTVSTRVEGTRHLDCQVEPYPGTVAAGSKQKPRLVGGFN